MPVTSATKSAATHSLTGCARGGLETRAWNRTKREAPCTALWVSAPPSGRSEKPVDGRRFPKRRPFGRLQVVHSDLAGWCGYRRRKKARSPRRVMPANPPLRSTINFTELALPFYALFDRLWRGFACVITAAGRGAPTAARANVEATLSEKPSTPTSAQAFATRAAIEGSCGYKSRATETVSFAHLTKSACAVSR
jgi:hypothetical protein